MEDHVTIEELTQAYEARCVKLAEDVEATLGRRVPRFRGLLASRGAIGATTYLVRAPRPSDTFTDLWAAGRLEHTVEAIVLLESRWCRLFMEDDRRAALQRLEEHGWQTERSSPRV